MNDVNEIVAAVVGGLALVGSLIARWTQTNPELAWWVRLGRVFDATQVVDSTRRRDD